jgi:predicted GH43/DUF377 family glycosyl hydrolase
MSYGYYAPITIHAEKVAADQTNYPVLIYGTYDGTNGEPDIRTAVNGGHVEHTAFGGASGSVTIPADLVFSPNSDGSNPYDFEIKEYNPVTGWILAWVKIPSPSGSEDTVFYMVYGDPELEGTEHIAHNWNRSASNPVLPLGDPGDWDDTRVDCMAVVWDGSQFVAYYRGSDANSSGIGKATSSDGVTWTKDTENNPLITNGGAGTWNEEDFGICGVVLKNGTWYLVASGRESSGSPKPHSIGSWSSNDGINFSPIDTNPVFEPAASGWDDEKVWQPSLYWDGDGNQFVMAYRGSSGGVHKIGIATSTDLVNFGRLDDNPIIEPSASEWDENGCYCPWLAELNTDEGSYVIFYAGSSGGSGQEKIGCAYANSPTASSWTKDSGNPILAWGADGEFDDTEVEQPTFLRKGSGFYLWYSGNDGNNERCGLATDTVYIPFISQENVADTWPNNIRVFHFGEDSGVTAYDSTGNENAEYEGDLPDTGRGGKLGDGQDFDGAGDNVKIATSIPNLGDAYTIFLWAYIDTISADRRDILQISEDNQLAYELDTDISGGNANLTIDNDKVIHTLPTGAWVMITIVKEGTGADEGKLYLDNELEDTCTAGAHVDVNAVHDRIGSKRNLGNYFDGIMDELRISQSSRDLNWVTTTYNMHNDPSTFYTMSSEQTLAVPQGYSFIM